MQPPHPSSQDAICEENDDPHVDSHLFRPSVESSCLFSFLGHFYPGTIDRCMFERCSTMTGGKFFRAIPELDRFLGSQGWEGRLAAAIDDWEQRGLAAWVERPMLFSIVPKRNDVKTTETDNGERDTGYTLLAASVISCVCHRSTDVVMYPDVQFILPQMDFFAEKGSKEIDAKRDVKGWTRILLGLGVGYQTMQNHVFAYRVWVKAMKADLHFPDPKVCLALYHYVQGQQIEDADFFMWSAMKFSASDDKRRFELMFKQAKQECQPDSVEFGGGAEQCNGTMELFQLRWKIF